MATLAGQPMIQGIASTMAALFSEHRLITNQPSIYTFLDWPMSQDIFIEAGPLAGIHAALSAMQTTEIFLVGCDMPFIKPELIRHICTGPNRSIMVPDLNRGMEPLFGRYHINILPALEAALSGGERKLHNFILQQQPTLINEDGLREIDPQLDSFRNINHQHDMPRNRP